MVDLDAARLQSVGNIGGTGYYYTNVICVFAMANFVLQLCNPRYSGEYKFNCISLLNFPIFVNLVDLVILATPVAFCDSRISVESGDSIQF